MTVAGVAVAALAALLVEAVAFAAVLRSSFREHARERQLLVNQLLHLSGQTWQPPPSAADREQAVDAPIEYTVPSHLPV